MLKKQRPSINNEKGMAVLELVPIIIVIILLVNFSLGFFGAIHTGILNSIAARNYAFETFRNRSALTYFTATSAQSVGVNFKEAEMRVHGITSENPQAQQWIASTRLIDFMNFQPRRAADVVGNTKEVHQNVRGLPDGRNESVGVNPIWIKTSYGICLTASCGS